MSLQDKKNELLGQLEAIVSKAKTENRSFSTEERTNFDKIETEIKDVCTDILREKSATEFRAQVEKVTETRILPAIGATKGALDKNCEALRNYIITGHMETRDLLTGQGVLIPTIIDSAIRAVTQALPGIEASAGVKTIQGYQKYPIFLDDSPANFVVEGNAVIPVDAATSSLLLTPFPVAKLSKVGDVLEAATGADFIADFVGVFAKSMYLGKESAFWSGSGTLMPQGLGLGVGVDGNFVSASVATATGSTLNVQLTNAIFQVRPEYRIKSSWVVTNAFLGAIMGATDTLGRPLNLVQIINSIPHLLGYPVVITPISSGTPSVGDIVAVFGDLAQYRIGQFLNGQYFYTRLVELYAASLAKGHLLTQYVDARTGRKAAFVKIIQG